MGRNQIRLHVLETVVGRQSSAVSFLCELCGLSLRPLRFKIYEPIEADVKPDRKGRKGRVRKRRKGMPKGGFKFLRKP